METTRADRKRFWPTHVADRRLSNPSMSREAEQHQDLCSGLAAACEGDTLQVAGPRRLTVRTQRNTSTDQLGISAVIVREDGGSTGNRTSSCLLPAAEKTFDTTWDRPMCRELAKGPAKRQCLKGGANSQAAGEFSARFGGVSDSKQKRVGIAESEMKWEPLRRISPSSRNSIPTTTDARSPTQLSSQFTKLRSFLSVFLPHKARANAYSTRNEESTVCRVQPQLVCIPPGSVFVPTDAKKISDTKTRGIPGSSTLSQQCSELIRISNHVAAPHSYASTHDAASISGLSRESCVYLDLSGRYDGSPGSSCESRSLITSSTASVQPRGTLAQHAFQHDVAGPTGAYAVLMKAGHKTGTMGKGTGSFCEDEYGEPTPNPISTAKPATVQGVNATDTDGRGKALESKLTATETADETGAQPAPKLPLPAKSHPKAHRKTVMPPEGCHSAAEVFVENQDHGRTTEEFSSRDAGWVSKRSATTRCRAKGQQCIAPSTVTDISKQVPEDAGGIFQGDVRRATERRVPIGRGKFDTCRPGAAEDICKAGSAPLPEGDGTVRCQPINAATARDDIPSGTSLFREFAEDRMATTSGSVSMLGSGTSGRLTHSEGDDSSCSTFFTPTGNFPARAPSVAPAAPPAVADTCATYLWKEDLLPAGHYWPAVFHRGEERCSSSTGIRRFRASSTPSGMRRISGACTENSAITSVSADERSLPDAVADTSTATTSVTLTSLDAGIALLSSEASTSAIEVRASFMRSENISTVSSTVALYEAEIPDLSAHVSAFSSAHNSFSREETMIDRPMAREHDFEPTRINSAKGGATFGAPGAKRAETINHIGRNCPQITLSQHVAAEPAHAAPNLHEICTTADFVTVPYKRETREPRAMLTPLPVCQQEKHALSVFLVDRSPESPAKPVRRRTSSDVRSKASSGPESGDFARSKLLSIVRSLQEGRQRGCPAQQDQQRQEPDVRGSSLFLHTQEAGEAAASQIFRVQQERAAGGGGCMKNQECGKSVRRGSLFLTSIRRERSRDSRKAYSSPTSEEQKESRRDEEAVVLKASDIVVEKSMQNMREESSSHCFSWLSRMQVETTGATIPVAVGSVVSPYLTAVAPDIGAAAPSTAAETARKTCTTTPPVATGIQGESVAAVHKVLTSLSPAYESIDRDVTATRLGTAAAATSKGSAAGEGVNIRRREGVHYSLLTWPSGVPRLKGKVESISNGHTAKHSQQQEEQTESCAHVWNGDSLGFQEFLEETTATESTPVAEARSHSLFPSVCNISSAVRNTKIDANEDSEETAAASSFPRSPEATARASTRAPALAAAGAGPAAYETAAAVTAAVSGKSGISASAAPTQNTEEGLLRTKRCSAETRNNGSPMSTRRRIFFSELDTHPTETSDSASFSRRKERVRNRLRRMASCPPLSCVHSFLEGGLVQHQTLRPLSKGSFLQLSVARALTRDVPLYQQRESEFATRFDYRILESRSATAFPDRSLSPICGRDTVLNRARRSPVFLLLRPRGNQLHEPYNLSAKQEQHCQRWKSDSSLCSVRQGGCEREKHGASVYLVQRNLRCAQHKRNLQVQQSHVLNTTAGQLQGRRFLSSPLQTNSCSYAEKRKSVSLLFQRRKTTAAACGSRKRTMSLDVKHARETSKSMRHRDRQEGAEVIPCSSESETTRCATSCGEGEFDETTVVLRSAGAAAPSCASVAAVVESAGTSSYASRNHYSQVRKALQQRRRRFSDTGGLQKGRHKPYSTEMSSWQITTADGRISVGRQTSCGRYPCTAASFADTAIQRSAPDNTTLLHCLPAIPKKAQQTNSGDTVYLLDSDREECVCSLVVVADSEALPRQSPSFNVSSRRRTYSSCVCHTTESRPDNVCSHDDAASQDYAQQMAYLLLGNTKAESIVLRRTGERHADTECEDLHEELTSEQDNDNSGVNSPASSMRSVVFTVEDSACEDFDDDDNLPFIELLQLLQHSLSEKVQQHPHHPMREYDTAAETTEGKAVVKTCGYGAALLEADDEGHVPGANTSTLLDCCQALDTYLKEDAREVDVYVPTSLHNLSPTALCHFFDTTELSGDRGLLTRRVKAAGVAVSPQTIAATTGGIGEGEEEGGKRRCEASVAEHTVAGAALADYGRPRGAAGGVTTEGAALERQRTKGSLMEQKTVATLSVATASSTSLTHTHLQAYLQQHASIISSNGNNTCVHHCTNSNKSEDECCTEPSSVPTRRYKKVTQGCSHRASGECSSGSVSISTSSSRGEGRIRIVSGRWGGESGRDDKEKWGPTHAKDLLSEKTSITCHVSSAEKSPGEPRSVAHRTDVVDVSLVENSKGDIPSADRTCEKDASILSSVPQLLPTSYAAAGITHSSRQPTDHVTGMVSLKGLCTATTEADHVAFEWPRVDLCATRTGDARVDCKEEQLLEKPQHSHMEQQQKQLDKEQQQTQPDGKQQQECDSWNREQQYQSAQQGGQKKERENAHAREQHGSNPLSMLYPSQGKNRGVVASEKRHGNGHVTEGCTRCRSHCLQEASVEGCTAAAAPEKTHSRKAAETPKDKEEDAADSGFSGDTERLTAQKPIVEAEVAGVLEGHKKHEEQTSACKAANSLPCNKEEDNTACLQPREETENGLSFTESAPAGTERIEANRSGTVIMQVKFSSLLLLLCDSNEELLAKLPYFEGPLCLSTRTATANSLRRQCPSYPRLLKSGAPAAAPAERLFYFVLFRGHLFWFTERSAFTSRGFDACVGSVSLLLNACRIVCVEAPVQQQQKRLIWGGTSNNSSSNCDPVAAHAATPSDMHYPSDRFSLQFYTHASAWNAVDKPPSLQSNIRTGSGIGRRSSFISGGDGSAKENADAILGEMELHVVSGAVFCPTVPVPDINCRQATSRSLALSAISAADNNRPPAVEPSDALSVYINGHTGTPGSVADDIAPAPTISSPACEGSSRSSPMCNFRCANASTAAPAAVVPEAPLSCMREVQSRREGSSTAGAGAVAAGSALFSFGRFGLGRSGRSAEKKAALACYAAAWVRHMQVSIAQGEDLRRRFPEVNWAQHQLRARFVASRCGVF